MAARIAMSLLEQSDSNGGVTSLKGYSGGQWQKWCKTTTKRDRKMREW